MQHSFPDRFSRLDSPIHRLPTACKVFCGIGLVVTTALVPLRFAAWLAVPTILLAVVAVVSRIPLLFLLRRILLLEPFAIGVSLLALFQPTGTKLFCLLIVRATLCLTTAILLANTTLFAELIRLMRRMRVPSLLVTTLALAYRYLFLFIDEAERMQRARAARAFSASRTHWWHAAASVAAMLFVRATERAERIFAAMCARGWRV